MNKATWDNMYPYIVPVKILSARHCKTRVPRETHRPVAVAKSLHSME